MIFLDDFLVILHYYRRLFGVVRNEAATVIKFNHMHFFKSSFIRCFTFAAMGLLPAVAMAYHPANVEFHNESADTVRINTILTEAVAANHSATGDYVSAIARGFLGTPYVAHTLEGDDEKLRVNLDELDCTTFVETVAALALTASEDRSSWRDFLTRLESVRYRGGEINGYPSRLHYISDWIVDNSYRGNIRELTNIVDGARSVVKSIDFMSTNRNRYPSLADSLTFERIKGIELGYRNHKYMYVPSSVVKRKATSAFLHEGDIVALTSNLKNLDVTHMGIVIFKGDDPYLLHASSTQGKVVVSNEPLGEFLRRNRQFTGIRIIRLRDL